MERLIAANAVVGATPIANVGPCEVGSRMAPRQARLSAGLAGGQPLPVRG
jgi:hypothetical protein